MLEAFAPRRWDGGRARRLVIGVAAGLSLVFGGGKFIAAMSKQVMAAPAEEEEPAVPVSLVETPKEQPEEPPPEEEPAPDQDPGPRALGPRLDMPEKVPDKIELQKRADETYGTDHEITKFGDGGGPKGGGGAKPAKKEEPKKEAPKAVKPKLNPMDYDAPKCKLGPVNRAAAKAAGVEGTVVVKYTVTPSGAVTNIRVASGPPELHAAAIAAVQGASCEPARLKADGSAISMTKSARFPFRLSTR